MGFNSDSTFSDLMCAALDAVISLFEMLGSWFSVHFLEIWDIYLDPYLGAWYESIQQGPHEVAVIYRCCSLPVADGVRDDIG